MAEGGEGTKVRLVIDASVAVKWVIPGEPWEEEAKALKDRLVSGLLEAYAPELMIYELASAIFKAVKSKVLEPRDGADALRAVGSLGINLAQIPWQEAPEILNLAIASGLTAYDAAYLWLSKKLNAKLVTADEELKRRGEAIAETILLGELKLQGETRHSLLK